MSSSSSHSLSSLSENIGSKENIDAIINTLIAGLKSCKHEYNEKVKDNLIVLEKLGFNMNDIPENVKQDLRNLFGDSEVMNFEHFGRKEHVTVNAQYLRDSLVMEDELREVELTVRAADVFLKQVSEMHFSLKQKLDSAADCAKHIEEQSNEKAVKEMIFKSKLEKKECLLKSLQKITNDLERPSFSCEEVDILQAEEKKLQEEVAILEAKLAKYHNLPLDEKTGAQLLVGLKEELEKVDNEIKLKVANQYY